MKENLQTVAKMEANRDRNGVSMPPIYTPWRDESIAGLSWEKNLAKLGSVSNHRSSKAIARLNVPRGLVNRKIYAGISMSPGPSVDTQWYGHIDLLLDSQVVARLPWNKVIYYQTVSSALEHGKFENFFPSILRPVDLDRYPSTYPSYPPQNALEWLGVWSSVNWPYSYFLLPFMCRASVDQIIAYNDGFYATNLSREDVTVFLGCLSEGERSVEPVPTFNQA